MFPCNGVSVVLARCFIPCLKEILMTLIPQQRDTLRRIRATVQRKLDLAMTSMAYTKGTNAKTVHELRKQLEVLNLVIGE